MRCANSSAQSEIWLRPWPGDVKRVEAFTAAHATVLIVRTLQELAADPEAAPSQ